MVLAESDGGNSTRVAIHCPAAMISPSTRFCASILAPTASLDKFEAIA